MFTSKISCVSFIVLLNVLCTIGYDLTLVVEDSVLISDPDYLEGVRNTTQEMINYFTSEAQDDQELILVTFNDPEAKLRVKTSNPQEFVEAVNAIKPHRGINNDCPQFALSGIELALKVSRPESFILLITGASAKDYKKFDVIKSLCESKNSQVEIIMDGDCDDSTSPSYTVYDDIYEACPGPDEEPEEESEEEPQPKKRDVKSALKKQFRSMKLNLSRK